MDRTRRPLVLEEAVDILSRTPATLDALLRDLPAAWGDANEGGDTWSPADVVAHLTYTDRTNWVPRATIILQHGEARAFDEFDRFGHLTGPGGETWPPASTSSRRCARAACSSSRLSGSRPRTWNAAARTRRSAR